MKNFFIMLLVAFPFLVFANEDYQILLKPSEVEVTMSYYRHTLEVKAGSRSLAIEICKSRRKHYQDIEQIHLLAIQIIKEAQQKEANGENVALAFSPFNSVNDTACFDENKINAVSTIFKIIHQ